MSGMYPYQERVYNALMTGRNVILQAPTGAGKTRAALYPYLENLARFAEDNYPAQAPLPLTCRYTVPMRVLATQFEREYRGYIPKLDERHATRLMDRYVRQLGLTLPAIQTGETQEDPRFESPLTFCTIDQLLASFIGTPFSLGHRQANLNVGAVVGSYLILDEFHLYPLDGSNGARLTSLAMLRMLGECCRYVLMTATFSKHLLDELGNLLNAEVVRVEDDGELAQILAGRQRMLRRSVEPMTAEAILETHKAVRASGAGASLVVCNTVSRAQDMYQRLKDALEKGDRLGEMRIELLHSRFTPQDRKEKSHILEEWLGEKNWKQGIYSGLDTIVVATQVVEVGLNISADVLHTELAPANSLVQRAGRCARFPGQLGEVIVYQIPERQVRSGWAGADAPSLLPEAAAKAAEGGVQIRYLPYQRELCQTTWNGLGEPGTFGWREEQKLIDEVHTPEDTRLLVYFREHEEQIKRAALKTLETHEYGSASTLIRAVASISVLVHPDPNAEITSKPYVWASFQLHPDTLRSAWKRLQEVRDLLGASWVIKTARAVDQIEEREEEDNDRETHYTWDELTSQLQIHAGSWIVLPPELAAYDRELGFRLRFDDHQEVTEWQSTPGEIKHGKPCSDEALGKQSSYLSHIRGLMGAYDASVHRELAWIATRLEESLGLARGSIDEAARLAIACHDIGKLANGWQQWAHGWQEFLIGQLGAGYRVRPENTFLAKTDRLRWHEERKLKANFKFPRPPHACAGAMAAADLISQRLSSQGRAESTDEEYALVCATISAIARHHAPTSRKYDSTAWNSERVCAPIAQALKACRLPHDLTGLNLEQLGAGDVPPEMLIIPSSGSDTQRLGTWLGFVLVRVLRLCDQRAEKV